MNTPTPADDAAIEPGERIGQYRLEEMLGAGGMGVVHRAVDTKLNRSVAIKFLPKNLADAAARRRFETEARTASSLNHPHILTVHDVGEHAGSAYIVTEWVDGGTLADWAEKQGDSPDARQVAELLLGVADALATAHEANILHRDVKPGNILVSKNGYAKLADFGLAKLAGSGAPAAPSADVGSTRVGVVIGTVAYMSPEQALGRPLDARSDIFAFGIVLYELLAGRRPFTGDSDLALMRAIVDTSPPELGPRVPAPLRAIVAKALEKEPTDRYQSMREVVVDLRRVLRQPLQPRGTDTAESPTRMPSVAVLPFASLSADKDNEYFGDGLAEEVINALAKIAGLKVIARTSAFAFKGQNRDIRQIAGALGVSYVLEGSVRRAGNRIRVTAQLITAADGSHLWSDRNQRHTPVSRSSAARECRREQRAAPGSLRAWP